MYIATIKPDSLAFVLIVLGILAGPAILVGLVVLAIKLRRRFR